MMLILTNVLNYKKSVSSLVLIELLQPLQIALTFSTSDKPPLDSSMICAYEKFNCVISVSLQTGHKVFPTSSPIQ